MVYQGVKAQKSNRVRKTTTSVEVETASEVDPTTVLTDVVLLQTAPQQFEYFTAPIAPDGTLRLAIETVV
jgi:hypothetical protein